LHNEILIWLDGVGFGVFFGVIDLVRWKTHPTGMQSYLLSIDIFYYEITKNHIAPYPVGCVFQRTSHQSP
jgi:hypothetical protein